MARKLQLKRRAERQQQTHQRIVEAAVAVHESQGVGAPISAIAERANVERLTVYRHFPDMRSLLTACTRHYLSEKPLPGPDSWQDIADPELQLRTALLEIYDYHRRTERMIMRSLCDARDMPVLDEMMSPYHDHWRALGSRLATTWADGDQDAHLVETAIGHAIAITTWHSLVREQGLEDAQAAEIMIGMVRDLARANREKLGEELQ